MTTKLPLFDATMLSTFLRSPKQFYWNYLYGGRGIQPKQNNDDLKFGSLWSEYVDAFYQGREFDFAKLFPLPDYMDTSFRALAQYYRDNFSPSDGVRNGSEQEFEWQGFCGKLDGVSKDGVIHECKATSRASVLSDQLWKYQNSIQIKLYACAVDAQGVVMEFAFKDKPNVVYRSPVHAITAEDKQRWRNELFALRNAIITAMLPLGAEIDENGFICAGESCNITSKRGSWLCPYKELCAGNFAALENFKPREEHLEVRK